MKHDRLKPNRRSLLIVGALLLVLFVVLIQQSVSNGILRLAIVLIGLLVIAIGLYLARWRWMRAVGLAIVLSVIIFLLSPGDRLAGRNLQPNYVQMLRTYEGSRYVWGGENHLGIDCSGLVREGLIQANLHYGFQTFNPALVRSGLGMWWFDAGADALLREYRGYTRRLWTAASINQIDHVQIQPGDLAVTTNGEHILAYLGDRAWIEADPNVMKVIIVQVPTANPWFQVPVEILRWQQFT
jgi:NlpC/P60 family